MNKRRKEKFYLYEYDMGFLSFLSIVIIVALILLIGFIDKWQIFKSLLVTSDQGLGDLKFTTLVVLMVVWVLIHELIHGMMYVLNGASKDNIYFGIAFEKGILYCLCKEYISKRNILISAISPFLFIGVLTSIIGIAIDNSYLVILSVMNMSSSIADIILFIFLLKLPKNIKFGEYDNSTGFIIKTDEDISKYSCLGISFIEVVENDKDLFKNNYKKFYISKISKYIVLFFILFMLLMLIKFFV